MRPKERRDSGQNDLFTARLDQIVDLNRSLAKLARTIDRRFLEERFGAVYSDGSGQPPLPTRLMAGLAILKHMHDLSDEVLCERWIENAYYQLFCGEEFFQHALVFDRSTMTRWRQRMGEGKLIALLQESLNVATHCRRVGDHKLRVAQIFAEDLRPVAIAFGRRSKDLSEIVPLQSANSRAIHVEEAITTRLDREQQEDQQHGEDQHAVMRCWRRERDGEHRCYESNGPVGRSIDPVPPTRHSGDLPPMVVRQGVDELHCRGRQRRAG